ncbi:hypothetical protein D3C71_1794370 [compost metagenome]
MAFITQCAQQVDNGVLGFDVDPGERLVQQQNAALLRQRPRQKDAFFLPAGKLADLAGA